MSWSDAKWISVVCLFVGAGMLWYQSIDNQTQALLEEQGQPLTGFPIRWEESRGRKRSTTYSVRFHYHPNPAERLEAKLQIPRAFYDEQQRHPQLDLLYLPADPSQVMIRGVALTDPGLVFVAWAALGVGAIGTACVAIFMAYKKFNEQPTGFEEIDAKRVT